MFPQPLRWKKLAGGGIESQETATEEIYLNETFFPNNIVREAIIMAAKTAGITLDHGDPLPQNVIESIEQLTIGSINGSKNITTLKGLEYFTNLTLLNCFYVGSNQDNILTVDLTKYPKLQHLNFCGAKISELDLSQNKELVTVDVSCTDIAELDLSNHPNLTEVECYDTLVTKLDLSNSPNLTYLDCEGRQSEDGNSYAVSIAELKLHPDVNLERLNVNGATIESLDVSQSSNLQALSCRSTNIRELDLSNNSNLLALECSNTQITSLDLSNTMVQELYCIDTPLESLILPENPVAILISDSTSLTHLNSEGGIALYEAVLNEEEELEYVEITAITSNYTMQVAADGTFDLSTISGFDPAKATAVENCEINGNILTATAEATTLSYAYDCGNGSSITFTVNVAFAEPVSGIVFNEENFPDKGFRSILKELWKDKNCTVNDGDLLSEDVLSMIETIDLSVFYEAPRHMQSLKGIEHFPNLTELICTGMGWDLDAEELPLYIDVSQNLKLEILDVGDIDLTELDLSKNVALRKLYCSGTQITELDVSNNPNLTYLSCVGRVDYDTGEILASISELDVSNNPNLTTLRFSNTTVASLDISNNLNLKDLRFNNTQISAIDLRKHTALKELYCADTPLTELDLSNNLALKELKCSGTQITKLDLSQHTALEELDCADTPLTELNLSNALALEELYCSGTQITKLDLSQHTALEELDCSYTQLTELDLSGCSALEIVACNDTPLKKLDLTGATSLERLLCGNTDLIALNLDDSPARVETAFNGELLTAIVSDVVLSADADGKIDLTTLADYGFKPDRASNWVNATVEGDILTVDKTATTISYDYTCNRPYEDLVITITVNVEFEEPEEEVEMKDVTVIFQPLELRSFLRPVRAKIQVPATATTVNIQDIEIPEGYVTILASNRHWDGSLPIWFGTVTVAVVKVSK